MSFGALKGSMNVALHSLCTFIVFIFLVSSAPISQFKGRGMQEGRASVVSCITVWGLKNKCGDNGYNYRPQDLDCERPKQLFQTSEAFYIISTIASCAALMLCGAFYMFGMKTTIPLVILGVANIAFALIPWACMTAIWHQDYCKQPTLQVDKTGHMNGLPFGTPLRHYYTMSAGYGLTVAAWCVQIIGLVILLSPI